MSTISTVKRLTASGAMAGVLGLAALGLGSGLAAAAPAAHTNSGSASSSEILGPLNTSNMVVPQAHAAFPHTPLNPHMGQGHKGWNEPVVPVGMHAPINPDTVIKAGPNGKFGPQRHELFAVQHGDV
ncbi:MULTISPECIES: hypothetical protein [unclassified Mycolicibacterium]|uniref:hypothetical protein n=1 Tax=unclassified Mycolicibacterium TaxID=2636767 RepID=UPI002EDB6D61